MPVSGREGGGGYGEVGTMSLINDMLRDLDARKRAAGQAASAPGDAASAGAVGVPHALDARTRAGHDSTDEHIRHRMRWLLPAYVLALVLFAVGLYLTFAGPEGVLPPDSLRAEERRGGKGGVSQCRSRWSP